MTESVDRSEDRVAPPDRVSESYVRTDERTNEEPPNPPRILQLGRRVREDDEPDSDSDSQYEPVPPHPRDIPAHHRMPEMQRLRAIVHTAGAKIPKEVRDDDH